MATLLGARRVEHSEPQSRMSAKKRPAGVPSPGHVAGHLGRALSTVHEPTEQSNKKRPAGVLLPARRGPPWLGLIDPSRADETIHIEVSLHTWGVNLSSADPVSSPTASGESDVPCRGGGSRTQRRPRESRRTGGHSGTYALILRNQTTETIESHMKMLEPRRARKGAVGEIPSRGK